MLLRDALKRHWGICKVRLQNGSEIPLLPARRPRMKKSRACNRCVRLKRACDRSAPCSTCITWNYECSYERAFSSTTSAVSEDLSRPETNIVHQQELSNGAVQEAGAIPVGLNDFIDYSLEWLRCESLPLQVLDFAAWNNIPGGYLHLEHHFDQATSRKNLVLPFLKRFTESSGIADGFDCGTVAQRRQLNETVGDSPCQTLATKTREIVSMMKRSMTRTRLCSDAGIEWSPVVEKACLDFFSPSNLHRFLRLFWSGWYPNSPIIHKPTFNTEAEPPGLIASMAVLGACLSPDSDDCVRAMAWLTPVEEAVFADDILYDDSIIVSSQLVGDESVVWDKLKALHAAYFTCIAQTWEGSKEGRQRVRKDRYSRIISIARSFGLYNLSMEKLDTTFPTQQKWAGFILLESMIRTATYIYLLDSAFVLYYRLPPRVISLELNTVLVCPEACFQAESAAECFLQLHMATKERPNQSQLTVSSAVRLLCSPHNMDLNMFRHLSSFNMFTIISALCCLVFQYQTTLIDASRITPAAIGLNRWIWLWQRGGHMAVDSDGYSIEDMWKRVGFMQHADEYYHLACAMLERWKLTEKQIGDTLAAWAAPLGSVQGNLMYDDGEMIQVKALIHNMENMTY
ncbi:unnamed protein product [Fusarium fujikuroi]|uniref:Zn(2)-C6 fungal-type domain-containing protein n=1 Tax=Fusarium fujikuroi TaxID=5127 RepID=A0A9Q9RJC8_FUSFU|nr:unnamed protein product [Fusarium fujikuroi]